MLNEEVNFYMHLNNAAATQHAIQVPTNMFRTCHNPVSSHSFVDMLRST